MNRRRRSSVALLCIGVSTLACAPSDTSEGPARAPAAEAPAPLSVGVVDVVARGLTLEAPADVAAGWTTFRFRNESGMVHFVAVERLPEGVGMAEQQEQVAPVFQEGMDHLAAGDVDAAMAAFGALPAWFGEVVFLGGPGLTSGTRTSEATVFLEPGTYLLECYVKTEGVFHSYNPAPEAYGMVHEFTVTTPATDTAPEPDATLRVTLSAEAGLGLEGEPTAGTHVFAVTFTDQTVHENFVGHDVHLAVTPEGTDLAALAEWMDWTRPDGLQTPAPVRFLGGLNEMPAGATGYFTATLTPGRYTLIAEVPGSMEKNLLHTFTVPAGSP